MIIIHFLGTLLMFYCQGVLSAVAIRYFWLYFYLCSCYRNDEPARFALIQKSVNITLYSWLYVLPFLLLQVLHLIDYAFNKHTIAKLYRKYPNIYIFDFCTKEEND